ncbi:exodeoxyribonuclease V subunit gamma [Ursidibacter maritimus]|uniref:RecBCD enzyme subunit RecC n=6 Tax=Ursidibacter maritimus TaxID=1331689 RepID=A0A949WRB0_9PAST|nr:exodeoxyribonuclease V subunit gamma [Ursidibacter maritimus]KAE9542187.1 exodeoxyribonuclease V subunit gamma [Ursidibacter maritimus]MBV6524820.1 exodeoxyribonuclease V subunit gamma [Ursidibacter maritimus]MBV6526721.1 exodeoxyribonuclease V subunit gamma [Ursidibacter maritimus]MBV6528262.1 exodeoxyribonuclease V subunit gamma [Ursidibacter maritimus]MBV6530416.1 exodeoxyribonuclease V subunit gamma [Ursidibacter maritimus]
MFIVYHSDQLDLQKELLIHILQEDPNPNPLESETILVQSLGMAQWLQIQISDRLGIAGNINFPYPTSFLWQQYRLLFPELPKENIFERDAMIWRLMRLIPNYLEHPSFSPLKAYLNPFEQLKLFQLASKIADLFDQYLVYRPDWLIDWEKGNLESHFAHLKQQSPFISKDETEIWQNIQWQSLLWNVLVNDLKQDSDEIVFNTSHRAYLQQRYFEKLDNLTEIEKQKLPKRIFIFGISSLPLTQINVLHKLSEHCQIHLFFTNPSQIFWADNQEEKLLEKLLLKHKLSPQELEGSIYQGNYLLNTWGKQGKEFLNLLVEKQHQEVNLFTPIVQENSVLLTQIKQSILNFEHKPELSIAENDRSIQIHSCHSKMREIEVLHNQLLFMFEQNPELSPKDIIVMSADIDSYAPYINAVFSRYAYQDPRFIPFTLSDQKISYVNPIIASFLQLLSFKERKMTTEEVLDLFDVKAIRDKFNLSEEQFSIIKHWVIASGVRYGFNKDNLDWGNYNSWENGINRLLLGTSLKEQNNSWQDILAFNESYGLSADLVGKIAKFIENLTAWFNFIQDAQDINDWKIQLTELINQFYADNSEYAETILVLQQTIEKIVNYIEIAKFTEKLNVEVIAQLFERYLNQERSNLNFLMGKVNFCTLLPMRAIPFKVVCLLGMNEGNFPRQQTLNSFDLMQYAPQKGDRARRDDDRYLFLEALLSAQNIFYISYIGRSLTDNSEKLPSVLVSQLLNFVQKNIIPEQSYYKEIEISHHPMTVFSPKNIQHNHISYDKEWLENNKQSTDAKSFITPVTLDNVEVQTEIDIQHLIQYLQSPVKFFFNVHLGVNFERYEDEISDAENFSLSHLDRFILLDYLVKEDKENFEHFFTNERLKGNLPIKHFETLSKENLIDNVELLKDKIDSYLSQSSKIIEIDEKFTLLENDLRLVGNIKNRFNDEVVLWRVGKLRDKDIIQIWIYHLILTLSNVGIKQIKFYYRDNKDVKALTFSAISKEDARALLTRYIEDYLDSGRILQIVINYNLIGYFKDLNKKDINIENYCANAISALDDNYIKRILMQQNELNYLDIHQRTLDWFATMVDHIKGEE